MLLDPIENLLNRNLQFSPAARELCAELRGQSLGVQLTGWDQNISVESLGSSLQLARQSPSDCTVRISGSPANLLLMLLSEPDSATTQRLLATGGIRVQGDSALLPRYRSLLTLLQPDFPAELETLLGDTTFGRTFAHQASRFLRQAFEFGRHAADTTVMNWAEYLAHETGDLVPRAEAEQFLSDVDLLRERLDRAQARLDHLLQRLTPAEESSPATGSAP